VCLYVSETERGCRGRCGGENMGCRGVCACSTLGGWVGCVCVVGEGEMGVVRGDMGVYVR
jgi:hypothetical protein